VIWQEKAFPSVDEESAAYRREFALSRLVERNDLVRCIQKQEKDTLRATRACSNFTTLEMI
jgi:hypothetical protein